MGFHQDKLPEPFMSPTAQLFLETRSVSHSFRDDAWEDADQAYIDYWTSASTILKKFSFRDGRKSITVTADWRPIVRRLERDLVATRKIEDFISARRSETELTTALAKLSDSKIRIRLTVEPIDEAECYAEAFIHDVYLMMNIAAPGSLNLYKACLKQDFLDRRAQHTISLSNMYFAIAWLDRNRNRWPKATRLPLPDVVSWYSKVRTGAYQTPRNRMEKVLFALLHLGTTEDTPATVVWLFNGLETLFGTRPGDNRRALFERAKLLLQPNEKEQRYLRNNLDKLYKIRSSFVHGGMEVVHPMHNELLDPAVEKKWSELSAACEFGFRLLLAALQRTIENGWTAPKFKEVLEGQMKNDDRQ
jgi:hypothetical protein